MDKQTLMRIANQSIMALSDDRVMIPAQYSESIADLKNVMRQILGNKLDVVPVESKQDASE